MVGAVGKHVWAFSSGLRPQPLVELEHWGGKELVRGKRVLDVGCGDGRFANGIAPYPASVDGVDPDPGAIAAARKNARSLGLDNARFKAGAAQRLPYQDSTFDVVLLTWAL
ncbi:MAG TPA: class I SAM-dependent methyltransferase [Candidatus Dormibacteraeota bacterium]|nr:class I SAM-dependent methyltransferase [Candidatus Dormibacteraeota bacterium]